MSGNEYAENLTGEKKATRGRGETLEERTNYVEMLKYLLYQNQEAVEGVVSTREYQFQNKAEHGH